MPAPSRDWEKRWGCLPGTQREIVLRMYLEAQTCTQIAAELGISLGTVKSRGTPCHAEAPLVARAVSRGGVAGGITTSWLAPAPFRNAPSMRQD